MRKPYKVQGRQTLAGASRLQLYRGAPARCLQLQVTFTRRGVFAGQFLH